MEKLGSSLAQEIEWSMPRLICIAGDFTKYDEYAAQQINRNISLIRYKKYGDDLLLLELMNATSVQNEVSDTKGKSYKSAKEFLNQSDDSLKERFDALKLYNLSLGDDVQFNELKYYFHSNGFEILLVFKCIRKIKESPCG